MEPIGRAAAKAVASIDDRSGRRHKLYLAPPDRPQRRPELLRSRALIDPLLVAVLIGLGTGCRDWPLYLHGGVGTGKTRAVLWFCDVVAESMYWTVDSVMDTMRANSLLTPPWSRPWLDPPHLVVLDELGCGERVSDFEYAAVKRFADWREGRPAVYVSNHGPDKIGRLYDRRIESRLTSGTVYELTGPDRRLT